jgi:uncharacterized repeat protein (TIGR03803 family)
MLAALFASSFPAQAQTYRFLSFPVPRDGYGSFPNGALIQDYAGNFYGTASSGYGYFGTAFEITAAGKPLLIHRFQDDGDGASPVGALVLDLAGNLYGVGLGASGVDECGLVYKIDALRNAAVIYYFQCSPDGDSPQAGLIEDATGNLYGTTQWGGSGCFGCGTVFRIDPAGNETVLYSFKGGTDGESPEASLVQDSAGNLYGTTRVGGTGTNCGSSEGCGTVFRLDEGGNETALYSFQGGADGAFPYSNLIFDSAGNLYGTTSGLGDPNDFGSVFKLDSSGNETVIYRFTGGADGGWPMAGLVADQAGNFYGTTSVGGEIPCVNQVFYDGCGTVFKVDQAGGLTTLHAFDEADGASSFAGLLRDASGKLYGDTFYGGSGNCTDEKTRIGCGVVFELRP